MPTNIAACVYFSLCPSLSPRSLPAVGFFFLLITLVRLLFPRRLRAFYLSVSDILFLEIVNWSPPSPFISTLNASDPHDYPSSLFKNSIFLSVRFRNLWLIFVSPPFCMWKASTTGLPYLERCLPNIVARSKSGLQSSHANMCAFRGGSPDTLNFHECFLSRSFWQRLVCSM